MNASKTLNVSAMIVTLGLGWTAGARAEPCELKPADKCLEHGLELLEQGDATSVRWFEKACESKVADACAQMGFLYLGSTAVVAGNDAEAYRYARLACDLGSGLGCANAAVLLRDARGAERDEVLMRSLAERSCTLGNGDGCFAAGAIYEEGLGGKIDLKKANAFLLKACDKEHAESCQLLANRHFQGALGLKKDPAKGAAFLEKACRFGVGQACNDLGGGVGNGDPGFPKGGPAKAVEYFARGCELGNASACENEKLARAAAAGPDEAALEGQTDLRIVTRSGNRVTVTISGGAAFVVGATGEVSKQVSQAGFTMSLVIGTVKVVAVSGNKATLEVVQDQSEVVIDGKKVNHWTPGTALEFAWKRAP